MSLDNDLVEAIAQRVASKLAGPSGNGRLAVNISEAAKMTGIDPKQISLAIERRQLPARRIGKSYRVSCRALLDWIECRD